MSYTEYITAGDESENPPEELARTNRFTVADLQQNRNGNISDRQWGRLLLRAVRPVRYIGQVTTDGLEQRAPVESLGGLIAGLNPAPADVPACSGYQRP